MSKEPIVIEEKKAKNKTNKVCTILYTITTFLWMVTIGLKTYGIVTYGDKVDGMFVMDVGLAICFACIAISYFCKYKKEKKLEDNSEK